MDASISQAGQDVISVFMRRTTEGILVNVRVQPDVEEFFKRWGGERKEDVRAVGGRLWRSGDPLSFWAMETVYVRGYTLNMPGQPLLDEADNPNISFIQLCGASEGVTFTCDMVVSKKELERMSTRLNNAMATFYSEYIKPAHIQLAVSARQTGQDIPF